MDNLAIKEQLEEIEHIKKVREFAGKVKDIKIAMLTTVSGTGQTHSRPMYTHQINDDGIIWFFSSKNSRKAAEIQINPQVNLSYSDPGNNLFVSVNGIASVVDDPEKIEELWSEMLRAWFPQGKKDPNIGLIRIDTTEAEYWDAPDSIVSQLLGVVKATLAGNPYKVGENKKINL
jgi:general stress protein 26